MAGTNILVRQKDLIAGSGISITPDTTSGNVTIAATNTAIDEARLLPTGGKNGNILEYQEGVDRGNGNDVRLLLQSALTDSASGNAAPAAVTTQGVTLTGDNSLLFSGNDSHVTAVLATDEIFAADKEWTIDFWMKPIANSSEWNYILTENRGDWGSHSIGLTWNKSKSVLEQDTGGYVASVIKAPNWPNNSIACAVGEWHFVAVEKQKTATGWSLNYYLNGAIWLQVAFTGEFVPFTSDNPFWFGGKTTDSGRWFKGEANKLRVTAGARYGGKAFAVPDRLIDYAAPAGQPVWTEGIDRSRLLPENPADGDIPCYNATATTGGGNDVNTKVLLHFDELPFADTAAGNASPAAVTNSGITLDTENFRFGTASARFAGGSNNLKVAVPQAQMMALPWLADCWFKVDDGQWSEYRRIFTQDNEELGGWTYYLMSSNRVGVWVRGMMPNAPASQQLSATDWHYAALVYCNSKLYAFVDGARFAVVECTPESFLDYIMLGKRISSSDYSLRGNIDEFRLQLLDEVEIGKWTGTSITVPDAPYSKPQTVGEWGKINKSELVVNDARLLPDAPSDTTNSYWLNSGPVATQVSPASYAGSTDATWKMELSGTFEGGDIATLFDSDTTNGVSGTLGLETFGTVRWIRKDQVPYRIDRIVLRAQTSDIGAFPQTIHLSGYDKSAFGPAIVQEFNAPVWETESDTSTYATSSFTRVCTLEVNAPAFQSYDYSIALGSGSGLETTLQAFAAYQLDTETAWKQLNTATTTTAGLMAAADKVKLDALQQAATYINIATDFNTYKTAGSYFLKGAAHTNGPLTDSYAGTLVVVVPAAPKYATQYFTQLYTNKTFVRTYSRENSAWSAWNRVIVDTDLATTTVAGLMSATDKAALTGLTTRGIYPNALAKSGAVDFNAVIDHGFYFIGGDTPHLNYPETYKQTGGTLQVIRNGNYLTQTLILFDKNKSFNRSCFNAISGSSDRKFSAWQRLLTDADITESKSRPGYFKLPGGTIVQWGNFVVTADPQAQEITLPVALSSAYVRQASGSNSSLKIGIYGGTDGKITCYVEGSTSGTVDWMVIGK